MQFARRTVTLPEAPVTPAPSGGSLFTSQPLQSLPLTAVGYVFAALLGKFILHEDVTPERWVGTALIFFGVALVGSTPQDTTRGESK